MSFLQLLREPSEVVKQRRAEEAAANAVRRKEALEKADERDKMKGKNKPTRRQKKKQMNIIEERKPTIKARQQEEVRGCWAPCESSMAGLICRVS
jgi:U3 small nucleolar RNA-associated protein 7